LLQVGSQLTFVSQLQVEFQLSEKCSEIHANHKFLV
jgi:hypothetical protein